jgi:Tfp pilus assembly protein PilF
MSILSKLKDRLEVGRFFRGSDWGWIGVLIACATVPYANTLLNGFVYDDAAQVLENPYVRSFDYLRQIFTTSVLSFTGLPSRYYRPVMTFGYLLCYKVFGFSPAGFHLVSVAFHAAVVCMLFFVTRRMFGDRMLAFGAATMFALHPIHSESVAWIAAVTDLELTFFYLLTFWFFLALGDAKGRRSVLLYFAMLGSFALALLSKEQAVTLPFLAMVYEHFYREGRSATSWARKFSRYVPLWLLAAAYVPLRMYSLGGFVVTSNYLGLTRQEVVLSAAALAGQYLWKLLWPVNLCAFYVFGKSTSPLEPAAMVGALCGILWLAALWWLWKRARPLSFGLIWLAVTLAPVLNPKWLGVNVFAERYLYLPSVGFCWVLAWGLLKLWSEVFSRRNAWRRAAVAALSAVVLLWTYRTVTRNRDWRDDVALYTDTLQTSPDADIIRVNLALVYQNQGLFSQAEQEYRFVLDKDPGCAECLSDLAWLYIQQARYVEAKPLLIRAASLNPKAVSVRLNLGVIYQKDGMLDRAEEQFHAAAALAPKNVSVHTTLAAFYEQQGDHTRAEAALKRALSINPYNSQARISLGALYETDGRAAEAIHEFQTVLKDEPGNFDATVALRRLKTNPTP